MLSKYCSDIAKKYGIKLGDANKLVSDIDNKSKCIVHNRNLQLCLSLGMKLTKIQKIWNFKQSDWLKRYIDFNGDKGESPANSFEKDFFKLMSILWLNNGKFKEENKC